MTATSAGRHDSVSVKLTTQKMKTVFIGKGGSRVDV